MSPLRTGDASPGLPRRKCIIGDFCLEFKMAHYCPELLVDQVALILDNGTCQLEVPMLIISEHPETLDQIQETIQRWLGDFGERKTPFTFSRGSTVVSSPLFHLTQLE